MIHWIKKQAMSYAGRKAATDARRYLEPGTREELATLLIATICAKVDLEDKAEMGDPKALLIVEALNLGCLDGELSFAPTYLRGMIQQMQARGDFDLANTFMPWLHTLRFYGYPAEMIAPVRNIWRELRRGLEGVRDLLDKSDREFSDDELERLEREVYKLPIGVALDD